MGPGEERPELLSRVEQSLCSDEDIEFALVFGSQISGETHTSSDVDIGVKFDDELSADERFQKRCFLAGDLQQSDVPRIDIVDVEALPIEVAHDAIAGEFLCGDETAFRLFEADITAAFREERDALRRQRRDLIDRIAEEGLRG